MGGEARIATERRFGRFGLTLGADYSVRTLSTEKNGVEETYVEQTLSLQSVEFELGFRTYFVMSQDRTKPSTEWWFGLGASYVLPISDLYSWRDTEGPGTGELPSPPLPSPFWNMSFGFGVQFLTTESVAFPITLQYQHLTSGGTTDTTYNKPISFTSDGFSVSIGISVIIK